MTYMKDDTTEVRGPAFGFAPFLSRRRHRLRLGVAGLAALALGASAAALGTPILPAAAVGGDATSAVPNQGDGTFADPGIEDRPLYRFWNTGGLMTKESIERQVAQIKSAGAGGFEANNLPGHVYLGNANPGYVPAEHGFGTPEFSRAWTQLFQEGVKQGLEVSALYTPAWSAGLPGLSPDDRGTSKEVEFAALRLDAGESFAGAVPAPALPDGVHKQVLQAVTAYRCVEDCLDPADTPVLDPKSAVDLTGQVDDGEISYAAPAVPGRYVVVASWMRGTGQTVFQAATAEPSYMVDHFGSAGAQSIVDYWNDNILTPAMRTAMRASKGSIFFDSLELNRYGAPVRFWTDDFLAQFEERRGYSLLPYLPSVSTFDFATGRSSAPAFEMPDDIGERVREDYRRTLSELFVDGHVKPLRDWAHSLGMTLRGQGYLEWGPGTINNSQVATELDIPEQEANNKNTADNALFDMHDADAWRQIASANAQAGRTLVSSETGTFGRADGMARTSLVAKMNLQFAHGMNKVIYHGWPDQSEGNSNAWPGYFPFGLGAPDNYGVQVPTFEDDKTINDYVARVQTVLRRGELRNDVAVYWDGTGVASYADDRLERAGFTYGFLDNSLVQADSAQLSGGSLTDQRYRALVVDATSTSVSMDLATAKRIRGWARAGFPVVVVGDVYEKVRGFRPSQDAALRTVLDELLGLDAVTVVPRRSGVVRALGAAGVKPAASYDDEPLVTLHRQDAASDYYYLFNSSTSRTRASVNLTGRGTPFRYDAWTGKVTPVASYTATGVGSRVDVDLASGESAIFAVTRGNADTARSACPQHATSTDADEVVAVGKQLVIRAGQTGRYATTLSNGKKVSTAISAVGAPKELDTWDLAVTSWHGGPAGPADTAKTPLAPREVSAGGGGKMPSWQEIDGLEHISGTSTYTANLQIDKAWTGGVGAHLDLGAVLGTAQITVNGRRLPPLDQTDVKAIDIGPYLKSGANEIKVHVATPVYNAGYGADDEYGLIGPVVVTPYGQAVVAGACSTPLAASATRLTASKRTFTRGQRVLMAAKVTSKSDPTGRVRFTLDGRVLATVRLDGKDVARVEVPRRIKVGRHVVVATYLGGSTTKPSSSKRIELRVLRRR